MRAPTPRAAVIAAVAYLTYIAIVAVGLAVTEGRWALHIIGYGVPQAALLITTITVAAAFWGSRHPSRERRFIAATVTMLVMTPLLLEGLAVANDFPLQFMTLEWSRITIILLSIAVVHLNLLFWPERQKK